ncbi:aminotransferase class V-fold PLP-dependent enzyme [Paraglaciecola chathamensis]|uniref:Aminotransferase class V-fold PLP-dependent enzyme n=1 Tax=Paraglaciecola chathamensis TaxID=368405 RepID=A0ABS0WAN6_9ALTE|nr:aminotransferase class V-fold PLP-dependent enzyme [Paraglaciecola chathamensis]
MQDSSQQFSLPKGMYLLSHSVGCLPVLTRSEVGQTYFEPWQQKGGDAWPTWLTVIEQFCHELSHLFNANNADFCPQPSVSSGLSQYLQALPTHSEASATGQKRRRVLMHASAFPSLGFAVQGLQNMGFELTLIDKCYDPNDLDAWQKHLSDDVAVAVITHVHSNTGVVSNVTQISQLCQTYNARVVVDVAQSAGAVPVDLQEWQVDALFGSCVKWLCGGPGAGFMWVNPADIDELEPKQLGWFSHQDPFEFDIEHFAFAQGAKRFWGGTPSILPYASALVGLQQINQIGPQAIHAHSKSLQKTVLASAEKHLLTPLNLEQAGGTLCLHLSQKKSAALQQKLKAAHAYFDQREDCFRLSWHIYNTAQEAELVADMFQHLP